MKTRNKIKNLVLVASALVLSFTLTAPSALAAKDTNKDKDRTKIEQKDVNKKETKDKKEDNKETKDKKEYKKEGKDKKDDKNKKEEANDGVKDPIKEAQENGEKDVEQIYPVYIKYNGISALDYVSEDTLNKLYKIIGDNQDKTFLTADEEDVVVFDSNNMYKLNNKIVKEFKEVLTIKSAPNLYKSFRYYKGTDTLELISAIVTAVVVAVLFFKIVTK